MVKLVQKYKGLNFKEMMFHEMESVFMILAPFSLRKLKGTKYGVSPEALPPDGAETECLQM